VPQSLSSNHLNRCALASPSLDHEGSAPPAIKTQPSWRQRGAAPAAIARSSTLRRGTQ
jgi:hypothetical protein